MNDDILTKEEVATMLACSPSTIEGMARAKKLPAIKIGRNWSFPRIALLQHLNGAALAHIEVRERVYSMAPRRGD